MGAQLRATLITLDTILLRYGPWGLRGCHNWAHAASRDARLSARLILAAFPV